MTITPNEQAALDPRERDQQTQGVSNSDLQQNDLQDDASYDLEDDESLDVEDSDSQDLSDSDED